MSHTGYRPTYERFISRRTGRHEGVHPGIYERLIPRGPSVLGRRSRRPLYDPLIAGERGRPRDPPRGGLCTAHNSGDDFPDPSIRWRTGLTAGRAGEALCGTTKATTPTDASTGSAVPIVQPVHRAWGKLSWDLSETTWKSNGGTERWQSGGGSRRHAAGEAFAGRGSGRHHGDHRATAPGGLVDRRCAAGGERGGCAKTDGSCWSKSERGRGAGAALAKKGRCGIVSRQWGRAPRGVGREAVDPCAGRNRSGMIRTPRVRAPNPHRDQGRRADQRFDRRSSARPTQSAALTSRQTARSTPGRNPCVAGSTHRGSSCRGSLTHRPTG